MHMYICLYTQACLLRPRMGAETLSLKVPGSPGTSRMLQARCCHAEASNAILERGSAFVRTATSFPCSSQAQANSRTWHRRFALFSCTRMLSSVILTSHPAGTGVCGLITGSNPRPHSAAAGGGGMCLFPVHSLTQPCGPRMYSTNPRNMPGRDHMHAGQCSTGRSFRAHAAIMPASQCIACIPSRPCTRRLACLHV